MNEDKLNLDYLSPTGSVGIFVLLIGILFTFTIFYFVFFKLGTNDDSIEDKRRKERQKKDQELKIQRLYPTKD